MKKGVGGKGGGRSSTATSQETESGRERERGKTTGCCDLEDSYCSLAMTHFGPVTLTLDTHLRWLSGAA